MLAAIGSRSATTEIPLQIDLTATDADGDPLTFYLSNPPADGVLVGSTFTWTPAYGLARTYPVTFTVADGKGGTDSETVTITVTAASISTSPIKLDFDSGSGDQGVRERHASAGSDLVLQLVYTGSEALRGYGALLTYDVSQVRLPLEEFTPGKSGWLPVTRSQSTGQLAVGAVVLIGALSQADLGTLHVHVDNALSADAVIHLRRVVLRLADGREQQIQVDEQVTVKAGGRPGDFNFDGVVDFSDFFLFADAFASPVYDAFYDLNSDGQIDFSDFFLFADYFAQPQQGKLMALAHQYLGLPAQAGLESTYPNPFNSSTTIRYRLAATGPVRLSVYSLAGQQIAVLQATSQSAGSHEAAWDGRDDDGRDAATGVYMVRLESAAGVQVSKVSLLR